MPTWDSQQYLKFGDQRTRPAVDLAARIKLVNPQRIIDLGCGPGNSTEVLAQRWPEAELSGLDSSAAMVATARKAYPQRTWIEGDLASWTAEHAYDLVYSNAALHWAPDHSRTIPRLFDQVVSGGAFAAQVPANLDGFAHRVMRDIAARPAWRAFFPHPVREWFVHEPAFYYDVLAPDAAVVDLWVTDYYHVMPDAAAIVEWYKGTGLRPFLDLLPTAEDQARFLQDYLTAVAGAYPAQTNGSVLFPFRRLFFIAYRK
jgi:trans-aconitate 2-methyltransferase